ncbi:TRAP transporter small permease [Oceanobacillus salinisoli]|uniref:TRAP transporter small permease n=1 Tax=Oceanobacillus salinisoli TaxID=2678611 RepID=UPI0018CC0755|nr:TRAP transporter small permease [Oceanobacillus salinisoli]
MQWLSNTLYKLSVYVISIMLGTMLVVTLLEVFARNVLGFSFSWSGELSRFLLIWITFFGASAVYKRLEMPAFDLLTAKLSEKKNGSIIFKITNLLIIVFSVIIAYSGFLESFSKTVRMQSTPSLNISMTYPYLAIPIGMTIILIHATAFLIGEKANKKGVRL